MTGLRRTDGQRVSAFLGSLLGGSTATLSFAAKHPTPAINAVLDRIFPLFGGKMPAGVAVRDVDCGGIPARLYEPTGAQGLIVYFHGGGFVLGSLETHRVAEAYVARHAGCKVLAIGYRKAPAHPFPAALEDCTAALRWALAHADDLGVAADRIAVGGDSAGGQLAAASCLELSPDEPAPHCAWLIYPVVDAVAARYDSARQFAKGPLLTRENLSDMIGHYAPATAYDDPRLTVIGAENLAQMPPTYIANAGMDPLRDQGRAFEERLRAAGVDVTRQEFRNLPHGFNLLMIDKDCRAAWVEAAEALGRALAA